MTTWCMCTACWISKATNIHTHVVQYSKLFHCNNGCTNEPQRYIIRTLSVCLLPSQGNNMQSVYNECVFLLMNLFKSDLFIHSSPEKNDSKYWSLKLIIIILHLSNYHKRANSLRTAVFTLVPAGVSSSCATVTYSVNKGRVKHQWKHKSCSRLQSMAKYFGLNTIYYQAFTKINSR